MARRVDLDAMIPREDFSIADEAYVLDLIRDFPVSHLDRCNALLGCTVRARTSLLRLRAHSFGSQHRFGQAF